MDKGKLFRELHHNQQLLVLPNVWDPLGALLLQNLGYPAVATASASVALSNGFADGQKIPFDRVLVNLQCIVKSVRIPVTADIESAYAVDHKTLEKNIKQLIATGIVGINFEDGYADREEITSIGEQCKKIELVKRVANQEGVQLFINARTDVYVKQGKLSEEEKLAETIKRGKAYKEAGADGFYPIFLRQKDAIEKVIAEVNLPVNIILVPGIPDFKSLQEIKLARLSLGPGFLKIALNALKNIGEKLLNYEGMEEITGNPLTRDYLNSLLPN